MSTIDERKLSISESLDNAIASPPDIPKTLEASILPSRTNKFKRLINSDNSASVKLLDEKYEIQLKKTAYVTEITISSETASKALDSLEFFATDSNGNKKQYPKQSLPDGVRCVFGGFLNTIEIEYNKSLLSSRLELTKINIFGWLPEDLKNLTKELDEFHEKFDKLYNEKSSLIKKIEDLYSGAIQKRDEAIEERNQLLTEIGTAQNELEEINEKTAIASDELEKVTKNLEKSNKDKSNIDNYVELASKEHSGLKEDISQKEKRIFDLDKNIGSMKIELERLENNKNLFAESFEEYSNQGASYSRTYLAISAVPITMIVIIAIYLLNSGEDIWKLSSEIKEVGVQNLIISKLPFTLLCLAVIQSMYSLAHTFIVKAIAIGRDRLQLSKSQLLAREAHDAIVRDLDIPKEVKYNYLLNLRMQMLKAHLSKNIDDYSHDPDANLDPELRTWYSDLKQYIAGKISREKLERDDGDANTPQ